MLTGLPWMRSAATQDLERRLAADALGCRSQNLERRCRHVPLDTIVRSRNRCEKTCTLVRECPVFRGGRFFHRLILSASSTTVIIYILHTYACTWYAKYIDYMWPSFDRELNYYSPCRTDDLLSVSRSVDLFEARDTSARMHFICTI